jgi:1-acyl-sn-glycerol-3-phosphate acyltransferase
LPDSTETISHARSNPFLAAIRIILILLTCLLFFVYFYLTYFMAPKGRRKTARLNRFAHNWGKTLAFIAGIRVKVKGTIPPEGVLYTPNHLGYADILALLSTMKTFLISRTEVAGWPIIGTFVRHSQQIIINREDAKVLVGAVKQMTERLENGFSICVFLEGTSSGGDDVLPFMPSLVQPAINADAPVVPLAVCWKPTDPEILISEDIAYWKDHSFGPHAWRFLGLRGKVVEIVFGQPIQPEGHNRKTLAAKAREEVIKLHSANKR